MRTLPTTALLFCCAVCLALAAGACRGNRSADPPVHPNPNMDFQQKYEAQEENDFYADQRAMRPPLAGTVARSLHGERDERFLRFDDHRFRGRDPDGRLVETLPKDLPLTRELIERGRERFNIYCAPCHDQTGSGEGLAVKRGFAVMPSSYHTDRMRAMPLGYFFDVPTNGFGTMQPYAAQIPPEDRWAIAAWVRTLQVSQDARLTDVPADAREEGWK